jgi:peroxiredoxin
MNKLVRNLLVALWLVAMAMGGTLLLINARLTAPPPGIPVGKAAPDLEFTAYDGRKIRLKDYIGRPVFLVTVPQLNDDAVRVCESLKEQMGFLESAGGKVFLLANTDVATAKAFHTSGKLNFPVLIDLRGSVAHTFGAEKNRIETIVVDAKGMVKFHIRDVDIRHHGPQLLAFARTCNDEVAAARSKGIGKPVEPISITDAFTGKMTPLYGDRSQKATLAIFMSTLCPCSNAYNERVRLLTLSAKKRGLRTVVIYANADETIDNVITHAKQSGLVGPVLHDADQVGMKHLKAAVTPEAFLMDQQGVLRYAGRLDDRREQELVKNAVLNKAIDAVLAGEKPPAAEPAFGCAITAKR